MNEYANLYTGLFSVSQTPQEALVKRQAGNDVQTTTLSISLLGTHPLLLRAFGEAPVYKWTWLHVTQNRDPVAIHAL